MKWPWRRDNQNAVEAQAELEQARDRLERVRGQWPAVHQGAASLRAHKDRNHFAESLRAIYLGRHS